MASSVLSLPVPVGIGVGATVDASALGARKTIIVGGAFIGVLIVEGSADGTNFVPVRAFTRANPGSELEISVCFLRVRVTATAAGAPTVDVAGGASIVQSATPAVPAGNGAGAGTDIRGLFDLKTFFVTGTFTGTVTFELSNDAVTWAPLVAFSAIDQQSRITYASFVRVVRANIDPNTPGLPIVGICASSSGANPPTGTLQQSACDEAVTFDVYVDSVSGDDANDGIAPTSALATIQAAYRKFPTRALEDCRVRINLADDGAGGVATYTIDKLILGGGNPTEASYQYLGPDVMVAIAPAAGPATSTLDAGTPADVVDVSGTPAGTGRRTRLNFTIAAPGWVVDDFQGAFARITRGGSLVVFEIPISKNDADAIFVDDERVAAAVLAGDTVDIVQPGAELISSSGIVPVGSMSGIGIGASLFGPFLTAGDPYTFRKIRFAGVSWEIGNGAAIFFDRCLNTANFVISNSTAGFANHAGASAIFFGDARIDASVAPVQSPAPLSTAPFIDICRTGGTQGLLTNGTATIFVNRFSCWDAVNNGLLITGGFAQVNVVAQGDGNGSVGYNVVNNSKIRVPTVAADRDLTGTLGFAALRQTGTTVVDGVGVGEFAEVAGYAGNFTEKNAGTATAPIGDASLVTDQFTGPA